MNDPPATAGEVANDPLITTLLEVCHLLLMVLDEQRRIVALNEPALARWTRAHGVPCMGLRFGDLVGCPNASRESGGCGASRFCADCGVTGAVLAAQRTGEPAEQDASLVSRAGELEQVRDFIARARPIQLGDRELTLLTLEDVHDRKRRKALERTFFHDVVNLVGALGGSVELLGETYLGGEVSFSTSEQDGTTFTLDLPEV